MQSFEKWFQTSVKTCIKGDECMKNHMRMITAALTAACLMAMPMTSYAGLLGHHTESTSCKDEDCYSFNCKDTVITMGAEASAIIKALGNPTKPVFEVDSCAYQGKDKVYTYPGYELSTCPSTDGKGEMISNIYFLDASISTPEGIKIGSTKQDVTKAYGTNCTEEFGVYHYKKGNCELIIYTTGSKVDGIEYLYQTK